MASPLYRYAVTVANALPGMVEAWGTNGSGECNRPATLTNAAAIVAREYQSVALTDSGSIVQWGQYSDGVNFYSVTDATHATQPPTSGVVAVAAGIGQGLALMTNGTVTAWGLSNAPGATIPAGLGLTNVTAIACGYKFDMALQANGTVKAWGDDSYFQTNVPEYVSGVMAISAGATHALALQSNGTVLYWGWSQGLTNPPSYLLSTNTVAIASGTNHDMALLDNGKVVAWGAGTYGQTNVPVGLSNVMAIAAGDNHCVALLNNGTLVEWGDNADGQADVPGAQQIITNYTEVGPYPPSPSIYSVTNPPFIVKLIAAGGNHTMATIFSPLVQYPVNVSKDLLLIYNSSTNSYSSNVCAYYMAHRPMASTANHLGISCAANEGISWTNYLSTFVGPIVTWLSNNPTLRPQYVILFHDLPSRYTNANNLTASVQYDMNAGYRSLFGTSNYLPYWMPFVTSINMNGVGGTNDCIQYINKLTNIGTLYASGQPLLSPNPTVYTNTNWYFDDNTTASDYTNTPLALYAFNSVLSNGVSASSVDYQPFTSTNIITNGTNVAGYFGWGCDGSFYPDTNYVTDKSIVFSGASSWFLMTTSESFNGQRIPAVTQASFLSWYASNAFGGTNYSNTAVAGVAYVDEPYLNPYGLVNLAVFYGDWAAGKSFAISAWAGAATSVGMPNGIPAKELQAIGDPFITR